MASTPNTPSTPSTPLPLLNTSRFGPSSALGPPSSATDPPSSRKPTLLSACFSRPSPGVVNDLDHDHDHDHWGRCVSIHEDSIPCVRAPSVPSVSLTRKMGAECVGTFVLIFVATAAVIVDEKTGGSLTIIGNAAAAGLAVMAVILSVGHISGAHLNPCLTISFAALRRFPWTQVPAYLAAQIVGSICASFALKGIFYPALHGGVTVPSGSDLHSFLIEFVISFNLMFVVTAVATDTRAVGELAGIAVGATVMMNILISGATSGGSMNPVRTLGPAIAANNYKGLWLYIIGPPLGALAGATAYTLIRLPADDQINGAAPARTTSRASFRRRMDATPTP